MANDHGSRPGSAPLTGGRVTAGVVRIGDTVRRPVVGDRSFQQSCLRHLESVGCDVVPRFLGHDDRGREILSFVPGEVPADLGHYDDARLAAAAALLRRFHDATADLPGVGDRGFVACHNDWAPTNTVFRDGVPVAMIDFDTLAPGLRLWDLGYSAFTWLDLGNDDYAPDEQVRRLALFAAAYDFAGCTAAEVAVFALARQTALAMSAEARGLNGIAGWASAAARWTALNVVERLVPTGYPLA
jgi:Ser/Thr protein kinase RdoA (MazF antagonist)